VANENAAKRVALTATEAAALTASTATEAAALTASTATEATSRNVRTQEKNPRDESSTGCLSTRKGELSPGRIGRIITPKDANVPLEKTRHRVLLLL
jgi:hypothetical protein